MFAAFITLPRCHPWRLLLLITLLLSGCASAEEDGSLNANSNNDISQEDGAEVTGENDVEGGDTLHSSADSSSSNQDSSGGVSDTPNDTLPNTEPDTPLLCAEGESEAFNCGQCGTRSRSCIDGAWSLGGCIEPVDSECLPGMERQDACGSDIGTCSPGSKLLGCNDLCRWEEISACSGTEGVPETCNYQDDDCDSIIDNGDVCDLVTVYESFTTEFVYNLNPSGTPFLLLYASNPDPIRFTPLYIAYRNGDTRLVNEARRLVILGGGWEILNSGNPIGYCINSLEDLPGGGETLFSEHRSLRTFYKISATDTAYALCQVGSGGTCDTSTLDALGGYGTSHPTEDPVPCFVLVP